MDFQKITNELLIQRFDDLRMVFPEVKGQLAICLEDCIKNVLGEATQVSMQPCRSGSVIKTSHQHHRREEEKQSRGLSPVIGWDGT